MYFNKPSFVMFNVKNRDDAHHGFAVKCYFKMNYAIPSSAVFLIIYLIYLVHENIVPCTPR